MLKALVSDHGRLREPILVSDQLQLRPLFRIPEVVAYESFDCSSQHDISQIRFIIIEQIISFQKSITFGPVTAYQRSLLDDTIIHT